MLPLPEPLVGYLSAFVQSGVLLLGLGLLVGVRRSLHQPILDAWVFALGAYAAAILALVAGSIAEKTNGLSFALPSIGVYMALEYLAGALLIGGARVRGGQTAWPRPLIVALAVVLLGTLASEALRIPFERRYTVHSTLLAVFFIVSAIETFRAMTLTPGIGMRIVGIVCALLAANYAGTLISDLAFGPVGGAWIALDSYIAAMLDIALGVGMVIVATDRAHDQLRRIAANDALSGVRNRGSFQSMLLAPPSAGVVAMIDVDHLKAINDRYGHRSGDLAITTIADRLRSVAGTPEMLFRIGGDEFVWVASGGVAASIDERLLRLNEAIGFIVDPERGRADALSITWGVAAFAAEVTIVDAMLLADAAMYARKRQRVAVAQSC